MAFVQITETPTPLQSDFEYLWQRCNNAVTILKKLPEICTLV